MIPVYFDDVNCVFSGPGFGDLPALKKENHIISCWKMTEIEKEEFLKTGKIYLSIMGNRQPPISLYVDRPYIRQ